MELNALVYASILHASELCLKSCRLLSHSEKAVYRLSRTLRQQPSVCTAATRNLLHARYCQTICRWQSVPPMSQNTMHSHQEILHSPRIDSMCGWSQKLANPKMHWFIHVAHFPTDVNGKKWHFIAINWSPVCADSQVRA